MSAFIISLDFELYWGVRAKKTIEEYRENLLGVRKVIPALLDLFEEYNISATFATVGFLFCKDKNEWRENFPELLPTYIDKKQSNYTKEAITDVESDKDGLLHFAPNLISLIKSAGHEIGTHTFSHFYCQEKGQTPHQFRADLQAAKLVAARAGIKYNSIVFPRNQFTQDYLRICMEENIPVYRGNPKASYYAAKGDDENTITDRTMRILDTYINLSGHNCYPVSVMHEGDMVNVPASMFLRPFSPKLSMLEGLRLRRITRAMTHAAKNNLAFHLWWHPHNFGKNIPENLSFLRKILDHYLSLSKMYSFQSLTMEQLAHKIKTGASKMPEPVV